MIKLMTEEEQAPAMPQQPVSTSSVAKTSNTKTSKAAVKQSLPVQAQFQAPALPQNANQIVDRAEATFDPYLARVSQSKGPVLNVKMLPKDVTSVMSQMNPIVARYKYDMDLYYKDKKMGSKNANTWTDADIKAATNADPAAVRKAFKVYDTYRSLTSLKQKPVSEVSYSPSFGGKTTTMFSYNPDTDFTELSMKAYGYPGYIENTARPSYFLEKAAYAPAEEGANKKPLGVALPTE